MILKFQTGQAGITHSYFIVGSKIPKQDLDDEEDDDTDKTTLHGGRIRSFKHERGNWATFIYVPALASVEQLEDFQLEVIKKWRHT